MNNLEKYQFDLAGFILVKGFLRRPAALPEPPKPAGFLASLRQAIGL